MFIDVINATTGHGMLINTAEIESVEAKGTELHMTMRSGRSHRVHTDFMKLQAHLGAERIPVGETFD